MRKRIYHGDFDFNGTTYRGIHEPLVTQETWAHVQELLDARSQTKVRVRREFAFTGLVRCGHCGCLMVGELKKQRYVYYHCTGNRGKCPEPYTREDTLRHQFASVLQELVIPREVLEWLQTEVVGADRTELAAREHVIRRHEEDIKRLQTRIETMYLDKLDGKITSAFFDEKARAWREQQERVQRNINELRTSALAPIQTAVDMVSLTSQSCMLFLEQAAVEQRCLLATILERATWKDGQLDVRLLEPFEQLRHSNQLSTSKQSGNGGSGSDFEIWLPNNSISNGFLPALVTVPRR